MIELPLTPAEVAAKVIVLCEHIQQRQVSTGGDDQQDAEDFNEICVLSATCIDNMEQGVV